MHKCIAEFIGTFFLVLTVGTTLIIGGSGVIAPLAIGSALGAMIFAGGHISGAHYNPAVTIGIWIRGKCPSKDALPYIIAQVLGAVFAAFAVAYLSAGVPRELTLVSTGKALLAEFLYTFALVYVVLNVATSRDTAGNSYYGFAIGMTVMAGAFAVGKISGAAFNPAVALGAAMMGLFPWTNLWIYFLAEITAGFAAGIIFKMLNPSDT